MKPSQFDALAMLCNLRVGPPREVLRLHFVDEVKIVDAAALYGISYITANQAKLRVQRRLELVHQVVS